MVGGRGGGGVYRGRWGLWKGKSIPNMNPIDLLNYVDANLINFILVHLMNDMWDSFAVNPGLV